jgi:hypothetical protein
MWNGREWECATAEVDRAQYCTALRAMSVVQCNTTALHYTVVPTRTSRPSVVDSVLASLPSLKSFAMTVMAVQRCVGVGLHGSSNECGGTDGTVGEWCKIYFRIEVT